MAYDPREDSYMQADREQAGKTVQDYVNSLDISPEAKKAVEKIIKHWINRDR
jgi:hypothetical protein